MKFACSLFPFKQTSNIIRQTVQGGLALRRSDFTAKTIERGEFIDHTGVQPFVNGIYFYAKDRITDDQHTIFISNTSLRKKGQIQYSTVRHGFNPSVEL